MFMTLIQYWYLTGDSQFNDAIQEGMYWQKGDENDFFPSNYSSYLGNDDQVFWGLAAMTAGELNFPERSGEPSWISLAEGVFNGQIPRWDMTACNGGLRWQIWPYQDGYDLKNAISNGGLFQLSARLDLCRVGREDLGLESHYAAVEENLGHCRYHYQCCELQGSW